MNPSQTDPGAAAAAPTEQHQQVVAPPQAVVPPVQQPAAVVAGPSAAQVFQANARQITNACMIAGRPELAGDFIASGASLDTVQARLLELRAQTDVGEVTGHVPQGRGTTRTIDTAAVYERWNDSGRLGQPVIRN